jgi:hypothetical protein
MPVYRAKVVRPLQYHHLQEKPMDTTSGYGEAQFL